MNFENAKKGLKQLYFGEIFELLSAIAMGVMGFAGNMAEGLKQGVGQRVHVSPRPGVAQEQFQDFMRRKAVQPLCAEAHPQTLAMPEMRVLFHLFIHG